MTNFLKKFLFLTFFFVFISICIGQHKKLESLTLDHQALIVNNIDSSRDFYRDVLLMEEIQNKAGEDPPKRWLKNKQGFEMHLIEGKTKKIRHFKSIHMAFSVKNMREFMNHLKILNVEFSSWSGDIGTFGLRDDGVKQIYLQDPTGYWIEINEK
tara:strand:+ start:1498 stop:1962 length:465 start_codon:yes stop_codon:yes gene_type:complete